MVKKYFARANTAAGCVNLTERNLGDIKAIYKLSGDSKVISGQILKRIAELATDRFSKVECVYNPFDIGELEGVIIRDIKTAFIDRDCAGDIKGNYNITYEINVQESEYTSAEKLKEQAKKAYEQLYRAYGEAKVIHDEWEKIYVSRMDFNRLEGYSKGVIDQLIGKKTGNKGTHNFERFFGASTPDGSVNYIDNITENLNARYFIKGRPGTGKSTFLKKLAKAANEAGFDTEIYYCSFDKKSLDMVLVPELSFCVFDSTAPHEMFPKDKRDSILDFYEESGLLGTDEECSAELADVGERYRERIAEGLCFLRLGNLYSREGEAILQKFSDISASNKIAEELFLRLI